VEASQQQSLKYDVPFSLEKYGRVQWFLRESPFDKCLRESLSGRDWGSVGNAQPDY